MNKDLPIRDLLRIAFRRVDFASKFWSDSDARSTVDEIAEAIQYLRAAKASIEEYIQ